jgi:hypothetical protein
LPASTLNSIFAKKIEIREQIQKCGNVCKKSKTGKESTFAELETVLFTWYHLVFLCAQCNWRGPWKHFRSRKVIFSIEAKFCQEAKDNVQFFFFKKKWFSRLIFSPYSSFVFSTPLKNNRSRFYCICMYVYVCVCERVRHCRIWLKYTVMWIYAAWWENM